jgi:hypothetical protein
VDSQVLSKNVGHVASARLARGSAFELMLTFVLLFGVVSIVRWVIGPSPISRATPGIVGATVGLLLAGLILSPSRRVSGGHANLAISLAMWHFGIFPAAGVVPYAIAQLLGSIVGVVAARAVWTTDGGLSMHPESNRLDRAEALRLWTVGNSWFSREDGRKGAVVPGQLANLAVLSSDYFSVPEEEIKGLESVLTVVGGKAVYAADKFAELSPRVPPVLPDWSPVAAYGGYAELALAPASARSSAALTHHQKHSSAECGVTGGFDCLCWAF